MKKVYVSPCVETFRTVVENGYYMSENYRNGGDGTTAAPGRGARGSSEPNDWGCGSMIEPLSDGGTYWM